jgi:hypothetical protein
LSLWEHVFFVSIGVNSKLGCKVDFMVGLYTIHFFLPKVRSKHSNHNNDKLYTKDLKAVEKLLIINQTKHPTKGEKIYKIKGPKF